MGRGMNTASPSTQLPRIIAIAVLVLVLLALALGTRASAHETVRPGSESARTPALERQ
jgi:MFS-type transporter involved in bile tolerance (Atg22 family)